MRLVLGLVVEVVDGDGEVVGRPAANRVVIAVESLLHQGGLAGGMQTWDVV